MNSDVNQDLWELADLYRLIHRLLQFRYHCLANSDKFVVGKTFNDQQITMRN